MKTSVQIVVHHSFLPRLPTFTIGSASRAPGGTTVAHKAKKSVLVAARYTYPNSPSLPQAAALQDIIAMGNFSHRSTAFTERAGFQMMIPLAGQEKGGDD